MLIQILQRRKLADGKTPGTDVDLSKRGGPKKILKFRPLDTTLQADPEQQEHVCKVDDPNDIAQLLAIRESFRVHASDTEGTRQAAALMAKARSESGKAGAGGLQLDKTIHAAIASGVPHVLTLDGDVLKATAFVPPAAAPAPDARVAGEKPAAAEANDQLGNGPVAGAPQEPAGSGASKVVNPEKMSKKELIAAVTKKTGRKPHLSTSEKKLRELLAS